MEKKPVLKKAIILFALAALIISYLYFSSPDKVVVNETAEIKGFINKVRAGLQGKDFWKDQLSTITSELQWELSEPQREAEEKKEWRQEEREWKKEMEEFYLENPDMRPSRAERRAERLRERADRIEEAEMDREFEQDRIERIAELRKILKVVQARAK